MEQGVQSRRVVLNRSFALGVEFLKRTGQKLGVCRKSRRSVGLVFTIGMYCYPTCLGEVLVFLLGPSCGTGVDGLGRYGWRLEES